jgi:hypothetical protein
MTKEDLIQFLIQDVEKRIEVSLKNKTNDYKMISLGPLGWTRHLQYTPACQQLGNDNGQVYYLTNRLQKHSKKIPVYPDWLHGYGEYTAPPTKKIEPNVFVAITTAFKQFKIFY